MAAGVNFDDVWASFGRAGYGLRLRRPPGVSAARVGGFEMRRASSGRSGAGVTDWKPGSRGSSSTAGPGLVRGSRSPRARPDGRTLAEVSGAIRRPGASFAQLPARRSRLSELLPKPKNLSVRSRLRRRIGLTYFTAYRMLMNRLQHPGRPQRPHPGRSGWTRRIRHAALPGRRRERGRRRSARPRGGRASGSAPSTTSTATSSPGMIRRGGETADEEKRRASG